MEKLRKIMNSGQGDGRTGKDGEKEMGKKQQSCGRNK